MRDDLGLSHLTTRAKLNMNSVLPVLQGRLGDSGTPWLKDDKCAIEALSDFGHRYNHSLTELVSRTSRKADEDYPCRFLPTCVR